MRLLLVEDEPYTREGILSAVDWNLLGISKILTAEDGQKGLDLARKYAPDIVLADMRMPKMDGADMAKRIKKILPGCAFIFMSGYSDIAYYKSALQVSALDYVSKPLVIDELVRVLEKGVKQVRENQTKEENLSILKSNELAAYAISDHADSNELMRLWKGCKMPCGEKYVLYSLVLSEKYSEQVFKAINGLAKTLDLRVSVGRTLAGYVIHTAIPRNSMALLHKFSQRLLGVSGLDTAYLAIGKPVEDATQLRESYENAIELLRLSFYYPERRLFVHGEPVASLVNGYDQVNEFSRLLLHNPPKALLWIENYFEKIRHHAGTPIELVKYWGFKMCTELYFQMDRIRKDEILSLPADEKALWKEISSLGTLDELKDFVLRVMDQLEDSRKADPDLPAILEVQRYIYNNFSAPLTLDTISEHVKISVTYLCSIFKEATGQTINQYILDVRMHRAKMMLESTHMHINEIAHATGYSSSSYFIKAFRKAAGITPQEYRKECKAYEDEA